MLHASIRPIAEVSTAQQSVDRSFVLSSQISPSLLSLSTAHAPPTSILLTGMCTVLKQVSPSSTVERHSEIPFPIVQSAPRSLTRCLPQ